MPLSKQSCPKCGTEIFDLLYCTPLTKDEYFCPGCGIKIQAHCRGCGTWLTVMESRCSKCGAKNPFFRESIAPKKR